MGFAVLVGEGKGPVLDVTGTEHVAEGCGCNLYVFGFVGIGQRYRFHLDRVVIAGEEFHVHISTRLFGQRNGEAVHTLVIVQPSLSNNLFGGRSDIIDVGLRH